MTALPQTQRTVPTNAIALGQIARSFGEAAAHYDEFAALQREVADHLLTSIEAAAPACVLDLGCGTGYCAGKLGVRFPDAQLLALDLALPMLHASAARVAHDTPLVCADMQALPLQDSVAHLAVSSLSLQWCADLGRVFAELWRVLQPGGQALLSTFGPATLHELRAAWSAVDAHVHVNGFVDKVMLERAAKRAGFIVSLKREPQARHYSSLRALARELKGIGAHNMNESRPPGLTPRGAFARVEQEFGKGLVAGQGIPVTWEVYYLDLRKPR
jgi:malonyl-CoA O-methyltransferase